jgi:hypothetical protein
VVAIGAFAVLQPNGPPPKLPPIAALNSSPSLLGLGSPGSAASTSQPSASPRPNAPVAEVAVVPIVGYWSIERSITTAELRLALTGNDPGFKGVVVAEPDLQAIAAALGVQASASVRQLSPSAVIAAVQGTTNVLGLLQPEDVRPSIRALGIDGRTLFGDARVRTVADWALTIPAPTGSPVAFDPTATWTVVAAGDVMNDRQVYREAVLLHHGPDFPWDGGTARIVSRSCCSAGQTVIQAAATGNAGAVAAYFRDADLALVNHEGPTRTTSASTRPG